MLARHRPFARHCTQGLLRSILGARRAAGALALAALCAAGAGFASAQTEAELELALGEVRALMQREKWAEAKARLVSGLEAHRESDYLPAHWTEIEEDVARCTFGSDYERPAPKELVSGDVRSWNPRTGAISLRYRTGERGLAAATETDPRAGDFFRIEGEESGSDVFLHPMLFKGPYSVELRGKELGRGELPIVFVGWDWNTVYGVVCGIATQVFLVEGGATRLLGVETASVGSPYRFNVRLTADSVSVFSNDRLVLKVKRPTGDFGHIGFTSFSGLEEVQIKGEIEPSWITGLADREVQHAWTEFRAGFDPFAELPSWMKDRVVGQGRKAADFMEAAPGSGDGRTAKHLRKAKEFYEKQKFADGLAYARDLDDDDASQETRAWLLSLFFFLTGETEQALEQCERVCEAQPSFYEGRLLRTRLIGRLRTRADARSELETLLGEAPEYVDGYEDLATLRFVDGDLEGVERVIEAALANGVPAQSLVKIGRNLLRARHGPLWTEPATYSSKHYEVVSDMERSTCFEIAGELEEFYKKYNVHLRRVGGSADRKFRVYFFSGVTGYEAYCQDLFGYEPESTLGLYSPSVKQLLVWNSPDSRMVMRTVRHEGFHQYLDCLTSEAPHWLNEGLAEYFEQATLVRGRWKDDQVNEQHLAVLAQYEWTPLEELVKADAAAFMSKVGLHYPQAWAFVHFLLNGRGQKKALFDPFIDRLIGGASRKEALDRVFGDVDWKALERELRDHVATVASDR